MCFRISKGILRVAERKRARYGLITACSIGVFLCPAHLQSQQGFTDKSHHAKELMDAGKAAEAVPIYRELARAMPHNPGFILDLGLALDMSGKKPEAVREYQEVLKLDQANFPALLLLGTAYLDLGQPAKALDPLGRAVKIQPGSFDSQETLAEALLSLGRLDEAERRFRELSRQDAGSSKVWYGLGLCYEGLAQQSFDALAKDAPGSAYWLELVAESRLETKQDYSSFYFYRQALAKMPGMRGVHAAIAEVYRDTGHADWAVLEEGKEKELPPPDCAAQKAECEFQAGSFAAVIEATQEATGPEAYYWRTRAFNKLALDAYSRLGALPPSVEAHELRAKIESGRRQYAEAAKELKAALQLSPASAYVQKQLAVALYKSGDLEGAQALFEQLLKGQPQSPDLNFYLGDTLLNSQKPQEAIPHLEAAVRRDPQLLTAQRSLGLAYIDSQHAEQAIPHLKQALPIDDDGSLHYQLARAYQARGERDLASAMLKEYQQMHQAQQSENKKVEENVAITPPE